MPTTTQDGSTARPWRVGDAGATVYGPPDGNPAPRMVAQRVRRSDAALIVRAVNAHEAMRDALRALIHEADMTGGRDRRVYRVTVDQARAALALANEEGD